jgi:nucleotide-binding universal stress UspA family protein
MLAGVAVGRRRAAGGGDGRKGEGRGDRRGGHRRIPGIEPVFADQQAEDRREIEELVARWARKHPDPEITTRVVDDREPSRALRGVATDAQLIVLGSRGHGPVAGALLGSTGNDLLAHATCPVAVVH